VHGEPPPLISDEDVNAFAWNVRRAVNQFLQYAHAHACAKRNEITRGLDTHERCQELRDWLLEQDPVLWKNLRKTAKPSE
jgi:hypothetical protein